MILKESKPAYLYTITGRRFNIWTGHVEIGDHCMLSSFYCGGRKFVVASNPGEVYRGKVWLEEDDRDSAIDKLILFEKSRIDWNMEEVRQHSGMIKKLEGARLHK